MGFTTQSNYRLVLSAKMFGIFLVGVPIAGWRALRSFPAHHGKGYHHMRAVVRERGKALFPGIAMCFAVHALLVVLAILVSAGTADAWNKAVSSEYGRVIIRNYSKSAGLAPVVFDHWLHRTNFTCRVCHIDIGFAMERGTTDIKASDNMAGLYCGTCHNGKMKHGSKKVFAACALKPDPKDAERCDKCHSDGKQVKKEYDFALFTKKFPKDKYGNMINWEKAEEDGFIKPADFLEGVSSKRLAAKAQKDFSLKSKSTWMSDIKFSHKKHLAWLGCETCHPEIFNIKKGSTQYTMLEISSGLYCGVCHNTVAFPLRDCQRCHTKPV